jgi:hypothetical protein
MLTMIYDRIEPLTPIKEPTVSNRGLSSMKPSATSAKPEYAFRTVMTTATNGQSKLKGMRATGY